MITNYSKYLLNEAKRKDSIFNAVTRGDVEWVKRYIIAGGNLDIYNSGGILLLQKAIKSRKIEIIKLLINSGIDLNIKSTNWQEQTPLSYAASLINNEGDVKKKRDYFDIIVLLLESGADPNIGEGNSKIMPIEYVINGNRELVPYFLKYGANVNIKDKLLGETPLTLLNLGRKYFYTLKLLHKHGADLNTKSKNGNSALIKLVQKDIEVSNLGFKVSGALIDLYEEYKEALKWMLENGADPNLRNKQGRTSLFYAKNKSTLKMLIEYGGDINIQDKQKKLAIHTQAYKQNIENIIYLIKLGIDFDHEDVKGKQFIDYLSKGNKEKILRLFPEKSKYYLQGNTYAIGKEMKKFNL